ncbi:MAG: family N-acetyltransferase [Gammaproteobacteria bacterium]|nr:family N-acetyltransferase [Gammaproteobacteria bacterium]
MTRNNVVSARKPKQTVEAVPERASRVRQRQRLIDACISALHIHGPSRTTVEKVVAIAEMSPGIVRFYFDSKDAMLVASLAYLAAEFEERVLVPVAQLRDTPVEALELLVDLYLDAEIASPRKVSVWYSFWGEASSRQEYYDICGRKDEDFAALVRDLIERVIVTTGESHLDTDGIALGLIGALEVLWQGIAFQREADVDRAVARAQSMAFLRSVFPGQFGRGTLRRSAAPAPGATGARLPSSSYSNGALLAVERARLFRPAWQVIGHEAEMPAAGDFLAGDLASERALVVRDEKGRLRAYRNACRRRPHALVSVRKGHFVGAIPCAPHGLTYKFDGRLTNGEAAGDLTPLDVKQQDGLILVRAPGAMQADGAQGGDAQGGTDSSGWVGLAALAPTSMQETELAADWKLVVEQWLESSPSRGRFVAPNHWVEIRPEGASILRVLPEAPGRSRLQRLDFSAGAQKGRKRARQESGEEPDGRRRIDVWVAQQVELAESTQTGLVAAADEVLETGPVTPALAEFRRSIADLFPLVGKVPQNP